MTLVDARVGDAGVSGRVREGVLALPSHRGTPALAG